jgi:hypothetical protein
VRDRVWRIEMEWMSKSIRGMVLFRGTGKLFWRTELGLLKGKNSKLKFRDMNIKIPTTRIARIWTNDKRPKPFVPAYSLGLVPMIE